MTEVKKRGWIVLYWKGPRSQTGSVSSTVVYRTRKEARTTADWYRAEGYDACESRAFLSYERLTRAEAVKRGERA